MAEIPTPKRIKMNPGAAKPDRRGVLPVSTVVMRNCAQNEQYRQLVNIQTVSDSSSALHADSLSGQDNRVDDAEKVIRDIQSRPKKKRTKAQREKWLKAIWQEAWVEGHYGEIPPALTAKLRGQLGQAVDRFPDKGEAIVRWAIANWRSIMSNQFAWMTVRPDMPDPGILLRHIMRFADAFAVFERQRTYDFSEQAEYKRLLANGMVHDEILRELGKRDAFKEGNSKLAEERARLALEFKALEQERKQLRERQQQPIKPADEVLREYRESLPKPPSFKTDYWSASEPPPIASDFGEWEDGE